MKSYEKPVLNGRTDRENLHILETWADNLVDKLNYDINHLDDSNMVDSYQTKTETTQQIAEAVKDLRAEIIRRTK